MLFNAFQVDKHILQVTNISLAQLAAHCCPPAGAVVSSRHAPLIPPRHHASPMAETLAPAPEQEVCLWVPLWCASYPL